MKKIHKKSQVCQMCNRSFRAEASYEKHIKSCEGKNVKKKIPQVVKKALKAMFFKVPFPLSETSKFGLHSFMINKI